ncbi:MAG: alpha-amylase, partial [Bacteroidota bacterium]|nr:alpha-amylase [Bacteroidota bacterium]MDX5430088.1 alpha-amylase [Bacteroidota bacterium]MDX5468852.1 alpha-amylase [Bacteroidota bacterium]
MLAEAEGPQYHSKAFDMTYTWENLHLNNQFAKGEKGIADYHAYWKHQKETYPATAYRMTFVTNHDENSWAGTVFERYGDKVIPLTVLSYTWYGMPLVYSGQEAGLNRRLSFFGKDSIDWSNLSYQPLITRLLMLRKEEKALWSGYEENRPQWISAPESPYLMYRRSMGNSEVYVVLNFSDQAITVNLSEGTTYEEIIAGSVCGAQNIVVPAGQARVYRKLNP